MEPLLDERRFSMGSGLMAKQPLSLFIIMLIVISSCLSGCSSKKKKNNPRVVTTPTTTVPTTTTPTTTTPTTTPLTTTTPTSTALEGEEVKVGDLMITFSTTNDLMTTYPSFKLGLYDIVAYIRTKDDLYRASLYDLAPVATTDFASVTPVELSNLKKGSHLYHGMFKAPVGKLESLAIQFVGSSSRVTIGDNSPSLIDAFFSSYTPGDSRVPSRVFPAQVITKVIGDINVADTKLTMVNVELDMNVTASMEPLHHADPARTYALFTPSIRVTEKTGSLSMSINQVDLVSVTDTSMGMGDPEGAVLTLNHTLAAGAKTYMNGQEAVISGAEGLYSVDMMGKFSASADGFAFEVSHASLAALAENSKGAIYQGKLTIDGAKASIQGTQQTLAVDDISLMGSSPFEGEIDGVDATALSLESGKMATIWSDGASGKLIAMSAAETGASKFAFDLHSTVSYTPADILAVVTAVSTDTSLTVTLPESLDCDQIVRDISTGGMKSCDTQLTSVEFTKATPGKFTLQETRQGKVGEAGTDGLKTFSLEADSVHHFTKAGDFLAALENRIKTDKYRLATMIAEGTVDGATFKVGSSVKAIILQPHDVLDSDSDGWIAGLEAENADALGSDKGRNIALYAGLGAAGLLVVGVAALIAEHVFVKKGLSFDLDQFSFQAVEKAEGSVIRAMVNDVDTGFLVEYDGQAVRVIKQADGSIRGNLLFGGVPTANLDVDIADKNGNLSEKVTIKKMSDKSLLNYSPRFVNAKGVEMKLFVKRGTVGGELKEVVLKLSNLAEAQFEGSDGRLYTFPEGDLTKAKSFKTGDVTGPLAPKYILAVSQVDANASKDKLANINVMFKTAIGDGTDANPGTILAKDAVAISRQTLKAGFALSDETIDKFPQEVQIAMKKARSYKMDLGLFTLDEDFDVPELRQRQAVISYVDKDTLTDLDTISEAKKARAGKYTAFIKQNIAMTHDKDTKTYTLKAGDETIKDIASMSFKQTTPAAAGSNGADVVTDRSINSSDPKQTGTLSIEGNKIMAMPETTWRMRKKNKHPAMVVATITDAGIVMADGIAELSFKNNSGVDVTDDMKSNILTEVKKVADEVVKKKAADIKDKSTAVSLGRKFAAFMADGLKKMKIPFFNTSGGAQRTSILESLGLKLKSLGTQAQDKWKTVRGKGKAKA